VTVQRVGGVDVVVVALTPVELMSLLAAVQAHARRLRRENGAPAATLAVVEARLVDVATSGRDSSEPSPEARSRHDRVPLGIAGAASAGPAPNGSVRTLSTSEAAAKLKVSARTVQRLFDKGALDGERVDRRGTARITATSVAVEALRRSTGKAPNDGVGTARTPPGGRGPDPGRDQGAAATA
jgi:excisionase family DNA binding protein